MRRPHARGDGTGRTTPEQHRLTHARGDASARVRRAPGRRPESPRRTRTSYLLATAPRPPGPATARARTLPHVAVGPVRSQQRAARPGRWSRGRALASDPPLDARRVLGERSGAGLPGRGRPRARAGGDDVAVGNRVRARARKRRRRVCVVRPSRGAGSGRRSGSGSVGHDTPDSARAVYVRVWTGGMLSDVRYAQE